MDFFRWLSIYICAFIYPIIPKIYSIFYFLANARFFSEEVIDNLSKNLYVLVSVVMLFVFSASLLASIVNPDLLDDKKKGFFAAFKRAIIGIILIVGIPFAFDLAYDFQAKIMNSSVIEKLILGVNYDDENKMGTETSNGRGGQIIAGNLIASVLYPVEDEVETDVVGLGAAYNTMVVSDIRAIYRVAKSINTPPAEDSGIDEDYALEFDALVAIIAGGAAVYILLLFAIDMAIRMFKLAFLELTAPISILAYIATGDEIFAKWRNEVLRTYLDVFIRIGAMGFYLFLISNLSNFFNTPVLWGVSENSNVDSIQGFGWIMLLQVLIIIGMLIFIKQVPELINKAFGTNLSSEHVGIGGRLGEMAIVGKQAKEAWGKIKSSHAVKTAAVGVGAIGVGGSFGLLPLAIGGGAYAGKKAWDKKGKDTETGKGLRRTKAWLQGGKKGVEEFDKENPSEYSKAKEFKEYEKELVLADKTKHNALEKIAQSAGGIAGLNFTRDSKGNMVLDVASSTIDSTSFAKMINAVPIKEIEKQHLIDYHEKERKAMTASNDVTYRNEMADILKNAISAESDPNEKLRLNDILTNLELGKYNKDDLKSAIDQSNSSALTKDLRDAINNLAGKISNSNVKIDSNRNLTAKSDALNAAFDSISQTVKNDMEKETDEIKAMMKELQSNSKKVNKKTTGTI